MKLLELTSSTSVSVDHLSIHIDWWKIAFGSALSFRKFYDSLSCLLSLLRELTTSSIIGLFSLLLWFAERSVNS